MENIITYVKNEFRTFEELPFSTVDSMVFSLLSYVYWPESVFREFPDECCGITDLLRSECFSAMFSDTLYPEDMKELFFAAACSPRYRNIKLKGYEYETCTEQEKQFAAITFILNPELYYVAFRGTDSTFVGWKEDLNLAFQYPVPAQKHAAEYVKKLGIETGAHFLVGGHSKGGNLAVAAVVENPELYGRIDRVFSHDGPGFTKDILEKSKFRLFDSKLDKTVPQSSVVGMLLWQHGKITIVKSGDKGFAQHNLFSWEIQDGKLVEVSELTTFASQLDTSLDEWMDEVPKEDQQRLVETVYSLFSELDVDTVLGFSQDLSGNVPKVWDSFQDLDQDTRSFIYKILRSMAAAYAKQVSDDVLAKIKSVLLDKPKDAVQNLRNTNGKQEAGGRVHE